MRPAESDILKGGRLVIVMISFTLLITLTGIDQTVLDTALVTIASRFDAVSDITWITSLFFFVEGCFMLLCGKILSIAPPKIVVFIAAIFFLIGNLLCGIAPNIGILLAGRAITGFGATGIWVAILSIIGRISSPGAKPILLNLAATAYGISSFVGPILGGVLTERISWRWCFYINLPIGGLGLVVMMLSLPNLRSLTVHNKSPLDTWLKLDWIGATSNIIGVSLFLTGLQLGGNLRPWKDPLVLTTLVLGIVISCFFVMWEAWKSSDPIMSVAMFKRRTIIGCFLVSSFLHWTFYLISFYMPILYQLRGHSVLKTSIEFLPLIGAGIVGGGLSSVFIAGTRHVWTWLVVPPFMGTVGFVFLATCTKDTSLAKLAGYQILIGFGLGATAQNCIVVAQAEYEKQEDLVPQVTSLVSFGGLLFSAIGTAVAGDIFSSVLRNEVQKLNLDLPPSIATLVLENVEVVLGLPEILRSPLIGAYLTAVKRTFVCGIVINSAAGFSALLIERKKISIGLFTSVQPESVTPSESYNSPTKSKSPGGPYSPQDELSTVLVKSYASPRAELDAALSEKIATAGSNA